MIRTTENGVDYEAKGSGNGRIILVNGEQVGFLNRRVNGFWYGEVSDGEVDGKPTVDWAYEAAGELIDLEMAHRATSELRDAVAHAPSVADMKKLPEVVVDAAAPGDPPTISGLFDLVYALREGIVSLSVLDVIDYALELRGSGSKEAMSSRFITGEAIETLRAVDDGLSRTLSNLKEAE